MLHDMVCQKNSFFKIPENPIWLLAAILNFSIYTNLCFFYSIMQCLEPYIANQIRLTHIFWLKVKFSILLCKAAILKWLPSWIWLFFMMVLKPIVFKLFLRGTICKNPRGRTMGCQTLQRVIHRFEAYSLDKKESWIKVAGN